ncbi:TRAP transporter small permease [Nitrospirota bacterium]
MRRILDSLSVFSKRIEDALLVLLLSSMIALATLQIIQRNLLGTGFVWSDELLRVMVLAVALIGAVAASRDDNHINIDILTRFLPPRVKLVVRVLVDAFTALVTGVVAWHAVKFVALEKEFESVILGDVPAWIFQLIIPICMGLISWRYLVYFFTNILRLLKGDMEDES